MNFPFLKNNKIIYLIIFLGCFGIYGNSIQNNYSLDDELVIENNELTQGGIKNIPRIFSEYSFVDKTKNLEFSYRPVTLMSFAIEVSLFGVSPHISHFINLLLFSICCCLLYYFLTLAFPGVSEMVIFLTLLLFISHPIHTEVVNNIKSRDEILVSIFGISALIQLVKYISFGNYWRLLAIILFTIAGLLSKNSFNIYMLLIPISYIILEKKASLNFRRFGKIFVISFGALFLIYLIKVLLLSDNSMSREMAFYENPLIEESLINRIPTGISISFQYLYLLIWPSTLSFYYGFNEVPLLNWSSLYVYLGFAIFISTIVVFIKYYRKNSFVLFGLIILLINLAASSNIYKLLPGIVAERFMFIGSIGFVMLLAFFLDELYTYASSKVVVSKTKKNVKYIYIVCLLSIFSVYSIRTYERNKDWNNYSSLFLNDVKHLENSVKANDMATFHILTKVKLEQNPVVRNQLLEDGIKYAKQCISVSPDHPQCWNNLGTIYFFQGNYPEAEKCYKKSNLQPEANVFFNLANIYQKQGKTELALEHFESAIEINPDLKNLIPTYKQFLINNNLEQEGITFLEILSKKELANYTIQLILVDLYNIKQDFPAMLTHLEMAYEIYPIAEIETYIQQVKNYLNQ